mmetsp:Transcript_12413/g.14416  ORF Transcript_12413/g.14416 Transcript_12413/m.14416 type:complete len:95 (+) Transcript_12413:145-429(+)
MFPGKDCLNDIISCIPNRITNNVGRKDFSVLKSNSLNMSIWIYVGSSLFGENDFALKKECNSISLENITKKYPNKEIDAAIKEFNENIESLKRK